MTFVKKQVHDFLLQLQFFSMKKKTSSQNITSVGKTV